MATNGIGEVARAVRGKRWVVDMDLLDDCEMRLEYWDAATETAWICDPVSSCHEGAARLLTESARLSPRCGARR